MENLNSADTIAAIATANGQSGIGIIRISGPMALEIGKKITQKTLQARYAHYGIFFDTDGRSLDQGIAIAFPAPHSFTGEDVVELQGHGGPIILDHLLKQTVKLGARLALPGEFSQRAFLNDKIDLLQAEAIADLIASSTEQASRSAMRSLTGEFSKSVHLLIEKITQLRCYIEAAIDFPEEEINFLSDDTVIISLTELISDFKKLLLSAQRGCLLQEGLSIAIIGKPNAGKSSLLNCLSQRDSAIVNAEAGTTRDIVRENIHIDGIPLHIIDTAGLRPTDNSIEQEGIRRTKQEIEKIDILVYLRDISTDQTVIDKQWLDNEFASHDIKIQQQALLVVDNKIDLFDCQSTTNVGDFSYVKISTKTGSGLDELKQQIKTLAGSPGDTGGDFIARRRHIEALERAFKNIERGKHQLQESGAGELLAEDLRIAQDVLGELTGEVSSDALLGRIFSSFCIGK